MFFDATLPLLFIAIIIGFIAQQNIQRTVSQYSRISSSKGLTADRVAELILRAKGLSHVRVEYIPGFLSDHYDPGKGVLRLSEGVYGSRSLAAIGIAAHEAGHAIQHAEGYTPMAIRHSLVPLANLGSQLLLPAIIGGVILSFKPLIYVGIIAYLFAVAFSVVTLPVELDASRRAIGAIESGGYLTTEEMPGAKKVLRAASMTYVAAVLVSLINLLRLFLLSRRD
ncbi:MAG: zinc metallopeptidase [bacterium]